MSRSSCHAWAAGGEQQSVQHGRLMFIRLKPRSERSTSADEIIQELRPKLATVPGIQVYLQNPPPIRIGGVQTKSQYQYTLQGPDISELYRYAPLLEARLQDLPGFQDVTSDLQLKNPQVNVEHRPRQGLRPGHNVLQIEDALERLLLQADLHDLCPQQRVPGHHGTAAAVPERPLGPLAALYPLLHREAWSR